MLAVNLKSKINDAISRRRINKMTEEKDFWINKDEVGILNSVEGTEYKVTQETMNEKGWYKLTNDEQIVKKAVLSKEEAAWFEENKDLTFFDGDSDDYFSQKVFDKMMEYREHCESWEDYKNWEKPNAFLRRLSQAYFTGYTIKEKKYYIKLNFNDYSASYLRIDDDGWFWDNPTDFSDYPTWFTQEEINQMQKDPQAKGLDLNVLKVEVPDDELED